MAILDPLTTKHHARRRPSTPTLNDFAVGVNEGDGDDPFNEEFYPSSDGKPMAETNEHRDLIHVTIDSLRAHFAGQTDRWISGNDFVYYEEGNPKARVSPDTYVVFDVPHRDERSGSFRVWEEGGRTPNIVFEFTSGKTKREDQTTKRDLYETVLKVPEYILFDPMTKSYLKPRLQGYRLIDGVYQRIPLLDGNRLYSQELGLELVMDGVTLRFFDPKTGLFLLTPTEARQRAAEETERANREAERAAIATRLAIAEAERALAATQHAEREASRASSEAARANAAEAENARLLKELNALRGHIDARRTDNDDNKQP